MNKLDLFEEKILHSGRHLRLYLPQFKGGFASVSASAWRRVSLLRAPAGADCDVDAAARFVASAFVSLNTTPKLIYHHFTTATDTSNIQVVFQVVMDTIIKENLEAVSLL